MTDIVARALALQSQKVKGVNQYKTKGEFPNIGADGALYIDNTENIVYYWSSEKLAYITLIAGNQDIPTGVQDTITTSILCGGSASDAVDL